MASDGLLVCCCRLVCGRDYSVRRWRSSLLGMEGDLMASLYDFIGPLQPLPSTHEQNMTKWGWPSDNLKEKHGVAPKKERDEDEN